MSEQSESKEHLIIDMHTHTFPEKIVDSAIAGMIRGVYETHGFHTVNKIRGTDETLHRSTVENGVDLSIVLPVATNIRQPEKLNQLAVMRNQTYATDRLLYFGAVHPDNSDYKSILKQIKDNGIPGIKIHPDYQGTYIDDIKYLKLIEYASLLGLIIVTHAGEDIGMPDPKRSTVDRICNMIKEVNPKNLILAHLGGWNGWDQVLDKLAGTDVYLDTSFCFEEGEIPHISESMFLEMIRIHGADKILFGTDSPWACQKKSLEIIRNMKLPKETEQKILGDNMKSLLEKQGIKLSLKVI